MKWQGSRKKNKRRNGDGEKRRAQRAGHGDDERNDGRDGGHAADDGEVIADGPTDGRCRL